MKKTLISMLVGLSISTYASAGDLAHVYEEALKNDPATLSAKADKDAAYSAINISRASLLPQISLSISESRTRGDSQIDVSSQSISLTQSLFSFANWKNWGRAELVASQADTSYGLALQNLILRVTQAYFEVLRTQDDLEFSKAEKRAIARQLEQTKQRFEVGLTAITDVHEAQALYDNAQASEIQAQNELEKSKESLWEITGNYYEAIAPLDAMKLGVSVPSPANISAWSKLAEENNLQLAASKISVDIARKDIDIAKSGHYPTLDLSANLTSNDTDTNNVNTDREDTRFAQLSLSVPLFSGGSTTASTEQARHSFVSASESREQTYRSVVKDVRSNYFDVTSAVSRIKALEQAVVSAESALKATEAGFEVGTRTIVDVLTSTQNVYDAKRNLSTARYNYITSVLSLKLAAGTLSRTDIDEINASLTK